MDLTDKVIVITGASKGLGKEIALKISHEKAKLALIARSEKELVILKEQIEENGSECEYFICDVGNDKQVFATVEKILKKFNRIDILVNNAGIWFEGPLEKHTPEIVRNIFDVVTLGTIFFSMAVIPHMRKQKSGQIMNINSIAGVSTPGDAGEYSVYTGAKHAITGFTKALEEELHGTGIKVTGFHPGGMNTEIFRSAGFNYNDNEDWMMDKKDVADIILFILKAPEDVLINQVLVRKFKKPLK